MLPVEYVCVCKLLPSHPLSYSEHLEGVLQFAIPLITFNFYTTSLINWIPVLCFDLFHIKTHHFRPMPYRTSESPSYIQSQNLNADLNVPFSFHNCVSISQTGVTLKKVYLRTKTKHRIYSTCCWFLVGALFYFPQQKWIERRKDSFKLSFFLRQIQGLISITRKKSMPAMCGPFTVSIYDKHSVLSSAVQAHR